jgi:hypothetical protein
VRARVPRDFLLDDELVELCQGLIARQETSGHLSSEAAGVVLQLVMKSFEVATPRDLDDTPEFIQTIPNQSYRLMVKPNLLDAARQHCSNDAVDGLIDSSSLH